MPAQGLGSKYVVLGGITSPASARLVSVSSGGGASVKSAPPSASHRRVSSSTRVRAGAISMVCSRWSRTRVWRNSTSSPAPATWECHVVPVGLGRRARTILAPGGAAWPTVATRNAGASRSSSDARSTGPDHPPVEGGQPEAVHRVDDAEDAGVSGLADLAPRRERGRDPVVPVGDVVVGRGQLVDQARGGGARRNPPHRLLQPAGTGEVEDGRCRCRPRRASGRTPGRRGAAAPPGPAGRRSSCGAGPGSRPAGPAPPRARAPGRPRTPGPRRRRPRRCRTRSPRSCR